jgi:hypothetical protein
MSGCFPLSVTAPGWRRGEPTDAGEPRDFAAPHSPAEEKIQRLFRTQRFQSVRTDGIYVNVKVFHWYFAMSTSAHPKQKASLAAMTPL